MSIMSALQATGLPCAYSHFKRAQEPPFIAYIQYGQNQLSADDTRHWHRNIYQVEYYFTEKSAAAEAAIEKALLDAGYQFTRSEDVYLEDEDVFVAYYFTN